MLSQDIYDEASFHNQITDSISNNFNRYDMVQNV